MRLSFPISHPRRLSQTSSVPSSVSTGASPANLLQTATKSATLLLLPVKRELRYFFACRAAKKSSSPPPKSGAFDLHSTVRVANGRSAPKGWSRPPVSPKGWVRLSNTDCYCTIGVSCSTHRKGKVSSYVLASPRCLSQLCRFASVG
jgi:hypothetical protein